MSVSTVTTNGSTNGVAHGQALTLDQARRYARHIILPEVGSIGSAQAARREGAA